MKIAICTCAFLALLVAQAQMQAPQPARTFLVVLDDLHIEFRATPRLRELLRSTLDTLLHSRDMCGVVMTGFSLRPTGDRAQVDAAIRRVVGGSLTPRQAIDAQQAGNMTELLHRARIAEATATDAINGMPAGITAVFYFSGGQFPGLVAEPRAVIEAAMNANVPMYAFNVRTLLQYDAPDVTPAEWTEYVAATTEGLRTLATATGGLAVMRSADLDAMVTRLR
jgi:hypothetical protein